MAGAPSAAPGAAVSANAVASEASKARESAPRVYGKSRFTWIFRAPSEKSAWIGFVYLGGSVRVRGATLEAARVGAGPSCTWYAVEPMGYVCAGGDIATTDPRDPEYLEALAAAPDLESAWPFSYAESMGTPRYRTLPSRDEQRRREPGLDAYLELARKLAANPAHEWGKTFPPLHPNFEARGEALFEGIDLSLAGRPVPTFGPLPKLAQEAREEAIRTATVAYQRTFDDGDGRSWAETSDRRLIPRDRLRPYPRSPFEGVVLGDAAGAEALPLAFFRDENRPKYGRVGNVFTPTGSTWQRLGHVGLTGAKEEANGRTYLETRETGVWVDAADAVVPTPLAPPVPSLMDPQQGRGTWIEVSTLGGWMIAYERDRPVFTTLISAGRGGVPVKGRSPRETASTPLGTFRIGGKFVTATMTSTTNTKLVHVDVNYTQNFEGPFALHGAYWHDEFGRLRSAGCLNLSPKDAKRMYEWTEPRVPTDWYGLRIPGYDGEATLMHVHR